MIDTIAASVSCLTRARLGTMRAVMISTWIAIGFAMALGGAGACTLISLATLGTLSGIAASAASTGREVYTMGKLDSAEMQRPNDVARAARAAAADLGLRPEPNADERGVRNVAIRELEFKDDKGSKVKVRIERRADRLVLLRIDVGIFGSEPAARLFLNRIRAHLHGSGMGTTKPAVDSGSGRDSDSSGSAVPS